MLDRFVPMLDIVLVALDIQLSPPATELSPPATELLDIFGSVMEIELSPPTEVPTLGIVFSLRGLDRRLDRRLDPGKLIFDNELVPPLADQRCGKETDSG